jgi:hypothetical protein
MDGDTVQNPQRTTPGAASSESGDGPPAATSAGMALLAAGVPLTLLLDLAMAPRSSDIAALEGGEASWVRRSA